MLSQSADEQHRTHGTGYPKHQHTYQRSCGGKDQTYNDGNNDGEQDLLQLGYGTKLTHLDLSLFLSSEKLHNRGGWIMGTSDM